MPSEFNKGDENKGLILGFEQVKLLNHWERLRKICRRKEEAELHALKLKR